MLSSACLTGGNGVRAYSGKHEQTYTQSPWGSACFFRAQQICDQTYDDNRIHRACRDFACAFCTVVSVLLFTGTSLWYETK